MKGRGGQEEEERGGGWVEEEEEMACIPRMGIRYQSAILHIYSLLLLLCNPLAPRALS